MRWAAVVIGLVLSLSLTSDALALPKYCEDEPSQVVCYAIPSGRSEISFDGKQHQAAGLHEVIAQLRSLPEKPILVQLVPTALPEVTYFDAATKSFDIHNFRRSETSRLTVQGVMKDGRALTVIRGQSLEDLRPRALPPLLASTPEEPSEPEESRDPIDFLTLLLNPPEQDLIAEGPSSLPKDEYETAAEAADYNCISLRNASHVTIQSLGFEQCWLVAVSAVDSAYITLRDATILGSTAGLYAEANKLPVKDVIDFRISEVLWIQDVSGYGTAGPCAGTIASVDCPGEMWRGVPWGVVHDAAWAPFNGGLFVSRNVGGVVRIQNNEIRNAYNGVRMKVSPDCETCLSEGNRDVIIRDNLFAYIRDNPVEPEYAANDWRIYRNRFYNSHGWISLDTVRGGPVHVFGNVGWFNSIPGDRCQDREEWIASQFYSFKDRAWRPVSFANEFDPFCGTHRMGTVFKLGPLAHPGDTRSHQPRSVDQSLELYVFHNSWMIRTPIFRGGLAHKIRHWNNAIKFVNCASIGEVKCAVSPADPTAPYGIYPTRDGKAVFLSYVSLVDPADHAVPLDYDFHHDISSEGFPNVPGKSPFSKEPLEPMDPKFADPEHGKFALAEGSPAEYAGCVVAPAKKLLLDCTEPKKMPRPHIGACQADGLPYAGPFKPEPDEMPTDFCD